MAKPQEQSLGNAYVIHSSAVERWGEWPLRLGAGQALFVIPRDTVLAVRHAIDVASDTDMAATQRACRRFVRLLETELFGATPDSIDRFTDSKFKIVRSRDEIVFASESFLEAYDYAFVNRDHRTGATYAVFGDSATCNQVWQDYYASTHRVMTTYEPGDGPAPWGGIVDAAALVNLTGKTSDETKRQTASWFGRTYNVETPAHYINARGGSGTLKSETVLTIVDKYIESSDIKVLSLRATDAARRDELLKSIESGLGFAGDGPSWINRGILRVSSADAAELDELTMTLRCILVDNAEDLSYAEAKGLVGRVSGFSPKLILLARAGNEELEELNREFAPNPEFAVVTW